MEGSDADGSYFSSEYLLIRELTHRFNNELASAIGLASIIAARSTDAQVKEAMANVTTLLRRYAVVHRAMQVPAHSAIVDASRYIRALCQSIRHARLDYRDIELVFFEHPLPMSSVRCWNLGLIVSELITNSVRHALRDRGGTIRVELSKSGPFGECCVADSGSPNGTYTPGAGLNIVEALAKELSGNIVHQFGEQGAISKLKFPLETEPLEIRQTGD